MLAPAKINLDLLITGRREDGYHLLDSLVVFTEYGDELRIEEAEGLSLEISGPFAAGLTITDDNLVLKAAKLICNEVGIKPHVKFHLVKNLPVSSGIGGGSSDAAAALKLLIYHYDIKIDQRRLLEIALSLGADVPVCLEGQTTQMSGIGEKLSPLNLNDDLYLLLINPLVSVSTPQVFKYYAMQNEAFERNRLFQNRVINSQFIIDTLRQSKNSLQNAAVEIEPEIRNVLEIINSTVNVKYCQMSGSGATCYGLYLSEKDCNNAHELIIKEKNNWWVRSTKII